MSYPPERPARYSPNPVFWILALPVIAAGVVITVQGIIKTWEFFERTDPFAGDGPAAFGEGAKTVFWGMIIFTIGCYIWRAARRRGLKDRFGRLLIIAGYVLLGFGLEAAVDVGTALIQGRDGGSAVLAAAVWAVPGAILAGIGVKMADEDFLLTATVNE